MSRILLVANPTAQSGENAERIERARQLLDRAGLAHDFLATLPARRTIAAVAGQLEHARYSVVVSMGGDGTFSEVGKGLLASGQAGKVPLGMLPTGTANDQGRSFGLSSSPTELEHNVEVIAEGAETPLDAGHLLALGPRGKLLAEDWFFDSAGWGMGPRTLATRNVDRKVIEKIPVVRDVLRDYVVYAGAFAKTFLQSYVEDDKFEVEVVVDGKRTRWEGVTDVVVKGTRVFGGFWVLDAASRHDDGRFEVIPFKGKRDFLSKALLTLDHSGEVREKLDEAGLRHSEGQSGKVIELTFLPHPGGLPLYAQSDGEEFPASPKARVEVSHGALRLIVPRDYATGKAKRRKRG